MPTPSSRAWPFALAAFAAGVLTIVLAYASTLASFPRVWSHSDTFTHCFFILPIAAWLVWRRRAELRRLTPHPDPLGLLALAAAGLLWFVSNAAEVLIYEQFAVVGMVTGLACAIFGRRVARTLTFPLAFLFFAVPFGESLQPFLMGLTAKFTAAALRISGVPVFVEGMFLTTPGQQWRVVEACSGLRFLVSMFTLGTLFAYLSFRRRGTRLVFGGLSIVMPIVANWLRAYTLILVGYLSDMKLGSGFDHYAIGWTLFTAVMALFFFVGSRWKERPVAAPAVMAPPPPESPARVRGAGLAAAAAFVLVLLPAAAAWATRPLTGTDGGLIEAPAPRAGWREEASRGTWLPRFHGTTAEARRSYRQDDSYVDCYIGYYRNQSQGAELIHFENVVVPRLDEIWRPISDVTATVRLSGRRFVVRENQVRSETESYLVWHWYWLPDEFTSSQTTAKILQARARILYRRDDAAVVILSAPYRGDPAPARAGLERFLRDMLPTLRQSLRASNREPAARRAS